MDVEIEYVGEVGDFNIKFLMGVFFMGLLCLLVIDVNFVSVLLFVKDCGIFFSEVMRDV